REVHPHVRGTEVAPTHVTIASSMELLLWRWSTTAQIASSLTIAIFFFVLTRSVKRRELRPWLYAWTSNLGALAVTVVFWYSNPSTRVGFALCVFGYVAF